MLESITEHLEKIFGVEKTLAMIKEDKRKLKFTYIVLFVNAENGLRGCKLNTPGNHNYQTVSSKTELVNKALASLNTHKNNLFKICEIDKKYVRIQKNDELRVRKILYAKYAKSEQKKETTVKPNSSPIQRKTSPASIVKQHAERLYQNGLEQKNTKDISGRRMQSKISSTRQMKGMSELYIN
ncbi:MAG: hypothetical protein COA43_03580 [Robiginitomaculum sp.]|nr:MAG: hypothetical protein COA43_03580 [Robiginitomaculum sp.]